MTVESGHQHGMLRTLGTKYITEIQFSSFNTMTIEYACILLKMLLQMDNILFTEMQ